MASMRKRKWQTKGDTRIAWIVDFVDRAPEVMEAVLKIYKAKWFDFSQSAWRI